jgi:uncharacterized membrane protein
VDQIFEFLFKYRPLLFQEGDFAFTAPWSVMALLAVAGTAAVVTILSYSMAKGDTRTTDRVVLSTLRLLTVAVLLFSLFRPSLILTSVVPQRNFVGVLIDDSRSMTIADADGRLRSDFIAETFGPERSQLLVELEDRFTLRFFRFGKAVQRIGGIGELTYAESATDLGSAMVRVQEELAGVPLSGLVVLTDGADNSGEPLAESLVPIQAASLPVYPVGLGESSLSPDIQVSRVEMPRTVLVGTSLSVDVVVSHRGYQGRTVQLVVEDAGQIIATEEVELGPDGEPVIAQVWIEAAESGPRLLQFRMPLQDDERVLENNVREVLVDVRDRTEKVLYFEGEPRWEVKFIRRALADDENVRVVVLQRTAENKFYRLNVDDSEELAAGFPRTREELFPYRAIILGSVEASFFTRDQLTMLADFVSERGGGLLVLGGRRAFAEGGYDGTPVADALPVFLDDELSGGAKYFAELKVTPTRAGLTHPVTQLGEGQGDTEERWAAMPPLTSVNPITRLKPGATALLTGGDDRDPARQIVLAHHRYGRGTVIAFPIQDSWIWQMHADVPLEDMTHEMFWRRLLRWLVAGVPDMVTVQAKRDQIEPGQAVEIRAELSDSAYVEVNDGNVVATIAGPSGEPTDLVLDWTVEEDGEYAASFTPVQPGLYEITVRADRGGTPMGEGRTFVHAMASQDEFFDASMRETTLRRIAEETGGRFYTPETVSSLPEDISFTGAGVTLTEERDLWDMPILLLLLLTLIGSEWAYRRARGLV